MNKFEVIRRLGEEKLVAVVRGRDEDEVILLRLPLRFQVLQKLLRT